MKKKVITWICIASIAFLATQSYRAKEARAGWGTEIPFLIKIIAETIRQVQALHAIIVTTRQTVGLLEEMNRGVKEVLRLAQTAHIPLPKQVFEAAKNIDDATNEAKRLYGKLPDGSPIHTRAHFRSGTESLFLSQDAFEYSKFLDGTGERIKSSAIVANQASATRLTAESLGVLLHAVSHSNRIQAKNLEISATNHLAEAAKEGAEFQSFLKTHSAIERGLRNAAFSPLNSFGGTK